MDGALMCGLPMAFPSEAYIGDESISWTQVLFEATSDVMATGITENDDKKLCHRHGRPLRPSRCGYT